MNPGDDSLSRFILEMNIVDFEDEIDYKLSVACRFELFMEQSIKDILSEMNINFKTSHSNSLCRVCTHGSTMLRTSLKNSDIDVVLVLANYLSRNQWFNRIVEKFEQNPDTIQDILPVIETFVPVIKLKFDDLQFDIVISCLARTFVPTRLDFRGDSNKIPLLYEGVDTTSIRGLSSVHIVRTIRLLTDRHRDIFTKFIRAIKIWTLKREIDSYIFGYPSAIAWVLMSFFVYQKSVQLHSSFKVTVIQLLKLFFSTFNNWNWPTPVVINPLSSSGDSPYIDASKYEHHLMPIISLVYPFKNTAFTVRQSSLAVIREEFKRANTIIHSDIEYSAKWKKLFLDIDLGQEYRHFIHLELMCPNDNFIRFKGLIASKLRDYALQLENINQILLARIHSVDKPHSRQWDSDRFLKQNHSWIIGIKLVENSYYKKNHIRTKVDITEATQCFFHILNEKCPYNNFQKMLNINYIKGRSVLNIIGL